MSLHFSQPACGHDWLTVYYHQGTDGELASALHGEECQQRLGMVFVGNRRYNSG